MFENTAYTVAELSDLEERIMSACELIDDLADKAERNNEVVTEMDLRTAEIRLCNIVTEILDAKAAKRTAK